MTKIPSEMRLFSPEGDRLYLSASERAQFLLSAKEEERENRVFCSMLHYTGARPSEVLELTADRISLSENAIVFRSLKKRKTDNKGNVKLPAYRSVPVPKRVIDEMDLVFNVRKVQKQGKEASSLLWPMSRATAWRMVKRVMLRANIDGKRSTSKGLRHGFGVAMLSGEKPLPINILRDLMGHNDTKITEIYLQAIGQEKRKLVMQAWD